MEYSVISITYEIQYSIFCLLPIFSISARPASSYGFRVHIPQSLALLFLAALSRDSPGFVKMTRSRDNTGMRINVTLFIVGYIYKPSASQPK